MGNSTKKVYEVSLKSTDKIHWVIANSKKDIEDFFYKNLNKAIERKDVEPEKFMTTL